MRELSQQGLGGACLPGQQRKLGDMDASQDRGEGGGGSNAVMYTTRG